MDMSKLLNPRVVELMEADAEGRVVVLPSRADEQRLGVERALEVKLFDWQVAYIWGESHYLMPGRGTGKTFAQIIKLCLSEGCPIILRGDVHTNVDGLGIFMSFENYRWFRSEVMRIYQKLSMYQVPGLRKIYFSKAEAQEASPTIRSYLWRF